LKLTGKNLSRVLACVLITGMMTTGTAGYFPAEFSLNEVCAVEASASDAFIATGTDKVRAYVYNDGESFFKMKGRTYYQGIVFGNTNYEDNAEITFSVEGINSISFDLGHVDGTAANSAEFSIFLDGILEDKFTLSQNELVNEYTLDVSGASVVRIFRNGDYSQYAFGDFSIDGVKTAYPHTAPEYDTSAAFLDASMDRLRAQVYDGSNTEVNFSMKGRTYYQGIVLGNASYEDDASVTFNVENADSISFSLGHVDNSESDSTEVSIFVDEVLEDKFMLTQNEPIKEYSLDVSSASTVRIFRNGDYSQYALADVTIDEKGPVKTYTAPVYKTSSTMISSLYDSFRTTYYDGSSQAISFNMKGRAYYQGIVLGNGSYEDDAAFSMNVENLSTLTFDLGHIDNTDENSAEIQIYLDNEIEDKFTISANEPIRSYTLDVSKAKDLRIYRTGDYSKYALGNIKADELVPKNTYSVPEYKNSAGFVTSLFDSYRTEVYDGVSSAVSFNMNGRTYYQGVIFGNGSYEDDSAGSFNVEKYSKVHFSVGHVDETAYDAADFTIYLDNEPVESFTLSGGNPIQEFDIDVTDAAVMRIFRNGDYSRYALADIIVDEIVPKNTVKIPEYQSASKMLEASYDRVRSSVYTDADKFTTFTMGEKEYTQGIIIGNGSYEDGADVSLNVEKIDALSFTLGCISSEHDTAELVVYGDGKPFKTIPLSKNMTPAEHTIDVSEYKNIQFYIAADYSMYGLAAFSMKSSAETPVTPVTTPAVTTAKPTSGTTPAVTTAKPTSGTTPAVTTAKPASGTTPAVTTAKPASGTTPAVTTAKPASGTTPAVTTAKPDASAPVKGDFNGDGTVTTTDVRAILKHIVGSEVLADEKAADIDGDGEVTTSDALRLLRFVIGEIDSL